MNSSSFLRSCENSPARCVLESVKLFDTFSAPILENIDLLFLSNALGPNGVPSIKRKEFRQLAEASSPRLAFTGKPNAIENAFNI